MLLLLLTLAIAVSGRTGSMKMVIMEVMTVYDDEHDDGNDNAGSHVTFRFLTDQGAIVIERG